MSTTQFPPIQRRYFFQTCQLLSMIIWSFLKFFDPSTIELNGLSESFFNPGLIECNLN